MVRWRYLVLGLSALGAMSAGCGKRPPSVTDAGYQDAGSAYAGLAFATVDADYSSSTLYFNDFSSGRLRLLSAGESGDPWLAWLGSGLTLFNRSATSVNFRTLDPKATPAALGAETATSGAAAGDPHAALLLDSHRLLLAMYNAGKIVVIDPGTGALVQTVDAAWGLTGATSQLRPEAFRLQESGDGTREIFVLHQGNDKNFKADGTQAIFVLKDDGKTVTAASGHGTPVSLKAPGAFFPGDADGQVLIYGECTVFDAPSCKQGFLSLTLATRAVSQVWDTGATGLKGNGGIVHGPGKIYYELMAKADGTKVIEKLDLGTRSLSDLYEFKSQSGCCALYFDDSSQTLYAGDGKSLEIFKDGAGAPVEVALAGIPYAGVLVPK